MPVMERDQWERVQIYLRGLQQRAEMLNAREAALDGRGAALDAKEAALERQWNDLCFVAKRVGGEGAAQDSVPTPSPAEIVADAAAREAAAVAREAKLARREALLKEERHRLLQLERRLAEHQQSLLQRERCMRERDARAPPTKFSYRPAELPAPAAEPRVRGRAPQRERRTAREVLSEQRTPAERDSTRGACEAAGGRAPARENDRRTPNAPDWSRVSDGPHTPTFAPPLAFSPFCSCVDGRGAARRAALGSAEIASRCVGAHAQWCEVHSPLRRGVAPQGVACT